MNGKVLKLHKWWTSHFGPMMAFIYLLLAICPSPPSLPEFLETLAIFTIASLGIGTFGQLLNDLTDVSQDVRTGTQNLVARQGWFTRLLLFAAALVVAIVPWWWLPTTPAIAALLVCEFVLFALYSLPPFRLKSRGILGPVTDALYGYVVPNAVAILLFAQLGGGFPVWLLAIVATWAFFFGLERIIHHQLIDASRDETDGVGTFVTRRGWAAAFDILRRIILPLGIISFVFLLAGLVWVAPLVPVFFGIYLVTTLTHWSHGSLAGTASIRRLPPIEQTHLATDLAVAGFVWRWLPLVTLLNLVLSRSEYFLLVPLHLLMFPATLSWLWRGSLPAFFRMMGAKSKSQ